MGAVVDSAGTINQDIMAGTMILVGLFVTFFGARFFKYIVFFVGFLIGAFLTYYSVPIIWSWFKSDVKDDTLLYMSLTVGGLFGVLLVVVYKAAVFSVGAISGAIFSQILWIAVVSNIDTTGKNWISWVQFGVLIVFALLGGWLAFKFVEQVLKAITAFIGGFMFASGIAFFISRLDKSQQRNVVDWVVFFGSYNNYSNLEDVCDIYCIICIIIWLVMFASGCFVQYKLHKKYKRQDKDGEDEETDSEEDSDDRRRRKKRDDSSSDDDSDSESSRKSRRKKKKRRAQPGGIEYDEEVRSEYAGSQYGGSVRQSNRMMHPMEGAEGRAVAPSVAMSNYGANYNSGNFQPAPPPGVARSDQHLNYGQRNAVQYV